MACGGGPVRSRDGVTRFDVAFSEVATSQQSLQGAGPAVLVGSSDASRSSITALLPRVSAGADRVFIAAFQGEQRTGGHAIQIARIERDGDVLLVHASFVAPAADSFVAQVITSPVHVVSIARSDAAGAKTVVLLDASGAEQARTDIT